MGSRGNYEAEPVYSMHAEEIWIVACTILVPTLHPAELRTSNLKPRTYTRSVKKTLSLNGRFCRFKDFLIKILWEWEPFNRLQVVDLRLATTPETIANYE